MSLRAAIGRIARRIGYRIEREDRYPTATLNPIDLGCLLLRNLAPNGPTIVQVGAFDGRLADPVEHVISRGHFGKVILVEPQRAACEKLAERYRDRTDVFVENVAITEHVGTVRLYLPEGESSPVASLDREHTARFAGRTPVRSIDVDAVTMEILLKKHLIDEIHLLQIDTEGHDYRILRQVFALGLLPLFVNLETYHLSRNDRHNLRQELGTRGYRFIDHGYDTFCVHSGSSIQGDSSVTLATDFAAASQPR